MSLFTLSAEEGLDHVAEHILSYIDAESLLSAELVCKEWHRVITDGHLWRKLIESKVKTDSLWKGLAERKGWYVFVAVLMFFNCVLCFFNMHFCLIRACRTFYLDVLFSFLRVKYLFRPKPGELHKDHRFYKSLYFEVLRDIQVGN